MTFASTVHEVSAGGLIFEEGSADSRVALIGKRDRHGRIAWTLPKGHVEAGETYEDTAVREIAEETGIRGRVIAPLGSLDYWFVANHQRIHKVVHQFLLVRESGALDDSDPEVDVVDWVHFAELGERLTYSNERKIVPLAAAALAAQA